MNKKRILCIVLAIVFLIAFLGFTYAVKTVDVQPIGPESSLVGFASFNKKCLDSFGQNEMLYELTQVIGWLSILICAFFGCIGAKQLFTTKSLKKVDPDLICMGIFYLLCIGAYVLFNFVVINYRPVLEDGMLEASYPSSHTIIGVCVFTSIIVEIKRKIKDKSKALIEEFACLAMICFAVGGRLLSGMHWATDIIGGLILSACLICIFLAILPQKTCMRK